jgi:hypothetical protein
MNNVKRDTRTQREREEDSLCDDLNSGAISISEYNAALRDMRDCDRAYAEECAERAYNDAMGGW